MDYTFFLSAHRTPDDMDHILPPPKKLINLKELKLYKAYCLTTMKLNKKSITERYLENPPTTWRLDHTLLNSLWVKEEISREFKNFELKETENTTY